MIAEDLDTKFGGSRRCRCGQPKDARLVMCNPCMVLMLDGAEAEASIPMAAIKVCRHCTRPTKPGSRFCGWHEGKTIGRLRKEHA